MDVRVERSQTGVLEVNCEAATWADFKRVVRQLKRQFKAKVITKADGPDSRVWRLLIEGREIRVDQWDMGPFPLSISSSSATEEEVPHRIAESLKTL